MRSFYTGVTRHRKLILVLFLTIAVVCFFLKGMVSVNYDMTDYLPQEKPSSTALDTMKKEFDQGVPNARIMIRDVSVPEALQYKENIEAVDGVTSVTWLDDAADLKEPLSSLDQSTVETYYKDNNALMSVAVEEEKRLDAVSEIRGIIGEDNDMTGSAVSAAYATKNTVKEIGKISGIAVAFVLLVLLLTTMSWAEPFLILIGIGVAVVINAGTNLIFGEISFVSNAAGSILQLAVSLDYSVFLIHRFTECRREFDDPQEAMVEALCRSTSSIFSSGMTTVIGFLALVTMEFTLGVDIGLVLTKGIAISLLTVFVFTPGLVLMTYRMIDKTAHRSLLPSFRGFGRFVQRITVPVVCIFVLVIGPAFYLSNQNDFYFGSSHIFGNGTQYGEETTAIEESFGQKDSYVLMVPKGDTAKEHELSEELQNMPKVESILSYVDNAGMEVPPEYLDSGTLSKLESQHYSRMVLTVDAAYEGDETFTLVKEIRQTAQKYYPDKYLLAGEGVSTCDLKDTVTGDMKRVNFIAIGAVFLILLLMMRKAVLPVILVLSIETAIWINLSVPAVRGTTIFYIAYLIISSIQLGATVDYAILMTDRYRENRQNLEKKESVVQTIAQVLPSILTSGSVLAAVGYLLGYISTNGLLAQLGIFIGRGALISLAVVVFVLPGTLYLFDRFVKGEGHMKKKNRNTGKKHISAALALMLAVGSLGAAFALPEGAFAAETTSANTPKEEVIYGNLALDGSVEEVNAVNIFDLTEKTKVIDYGSYSSVRNMTTTDKIKNKDGKTTVTADKGRLYYEGSMKNSELPWNVSITYYINGKQVAADQLAGKSGRLRIHTEIKKNTDCADSFYEGYALQATYTFDAAKCMNFSADGATEANVGGQKQFTYTILPDKGADLDLTADVTDFEMDAIQINGVRMDLDLDVDTSSFDGKISQITDAVASADDGAGSLSKGAGALHDAIGLVEDKTGDLVSGSGALVSGAEELSGGLSKLSGKGDDLNAGAQETYEKLCQSAASQINSMLMAAGMPEISLTPSTYAKTLTALAAQLSAAGQSDAAAQVKQVKASLDQYGTFYSGLKAYIEGVDGSAAGAAALQQNLGNLQTGAASLQSGIRKLDQASGKLAQGAAQLKAGTSQFREKTAGLDGQISDVVDDMVSAVTGKDVAVRSFVSPKNTEIKSVQFVLKTEPVEQ